MPRILATAVALTVVLSPQLAQAKLSCYPLAQIEKALDSEYGESRSFSGRESTGIEYRLYINTKTGSWSWIGIPAGANVGCLIFTGTGDAQPPLARPPEQAPQAQF